MRAGAEEDAELEVLVLTAPPSRHARTPSYLARHNLDPPAPHILLTTLQSPLGHPASGNISTSRQDADDPLRCC